MKIVIDYSGDGLGLSAYAVEQLRCRTITGAGRNDRLLDYCTLNPRSEAILSLIRDKCGVIPTCWP